MRKIAPDVLIILLSGVVSFYVSISHPEFNNLEMDALWLVIISGGVSILTLIIYTVIAIWFRKFYRQNRWAIVGILSSINIITGIVVFFTDW